MRVLDLGCGTNKEPGAIGADVSRESQADIICDLNRYPLPFKSDSFERVVSKQVFEHLDDVEGLMREVHRICRDKARVCVYVPHFSCFYSYGDPTHKRTFSAFSFDKIAPRAGFTIMTRKISFHRAFRRYMIDSLANRFPVGYERFWAFMLPAEHLYFEFQVNKGAVKQ